MSIKNQLDFFKKIVLSNYQEQIGHEILLEIKSRLQFLYDVGLSYIDLVREAGTLSGGEAQRIRLATQIGSSLSGVLYVLDEPSIGLHQKDNIRLINTLKKLKNLGNTLIVVEHDREIMESSDYIVDIGPGAGVNGGEIVFQGTYEEMLKSDSLTAKYLKNEKEVFVKKETREGNGLSIKIIGAYENNLKNINVTLPLAKLICITGVSGSGKSTLINNILYPSVMNKLHKHSKYKEGSYKEILGVENIDKIIYIDQNPIGKSSHSNPATYTGVFDNIRSFYSSLENSKIRGYKPGRFSFFKKGGRCEDCRGYGVKKIEMQFLPDVYIECETCNGKRYNTETLKIEYKSKNIYDILNMTVDDAVDFFAGVSSIKNKLKTIQDVGLGYIKLGQPAPSLSGGEAQRVKLANELIKRSTGKTLYLLDEPTTGLHFEDISKLLYILNLLVDKGNTVVLIEHNLDLIKVADHIIDMGVDGGQDGGFIIATGTPKDISYNKKSITGWYLKKYFEN